MCNEVEQSSTSSQGTESCQSENDSATRADNLLDKYANKVCIYLILITVINIIIHLSLETLIPTYLNIKRFPGLEMKWFGHLWHRKADFEASVVVSSCEEGIDFVQKYIGNQKSSHVTVSARIISGCGLVPTDTLPNHFSLVKSKWQFAGQHFIEWMLDLLESFASDDLPEYYNHDNHFIIFLDTQVPEKKRVRSLDIVLQQAKENGFGCIQVPQTQDVSYYHDLRL